MDIHPYSGFEGRSWEMRASISLCMIVKDEEATLARCLSSAMDIADEIVVVDTGSADRTVEIAKGYTELVYSFDWIDDFAAARNYAFGLATKDYILWLDADDVIEPRDRELIADLTEKLGTTKGIDAVSMPYILSADGSGAAQASIRRIRLVLRERGFRWFEPVHEYLAVTGNVAHSDAAVTHRKVKSSGDRNLRIYENKLAEGADFSARERYYYANELLDRSRTDDAAEAYEAFLAAEDGWAEDRLVACHKLAYCRAVQGRREERLEALRRALLIDGSRAETCCELGMLHMESAEWEEAIAWFKRAASLPKPDKALGKILHHPSWTWLPHLRLCECYLAKGDPNKAFLYHSIAEIYEPERPEIARNKAYFKEKHGLSGIGWQFGETD